MDYSLLRHLAEKGSVRGPYSGPLLPLLASRLLSGEWPLPLWCRGLTSAELAAIERRKGEAKNVRSLGSSHCGNNSLVAGVRLVLRRILRRPE